MLYFRGNQIYLPWEKETKKPEEEKSLSEVTESEDRKHLKKERQKAVNE
jgi:hypothetical protein